MAGVSFRSPVSRELHLQAEVSDERRLAVHSLATYDAAAGHEKDEQALVKLISSADIEVLEPAGVARCPHPLLKQGEGVGLLPRLHYLALLPHKLCKQSFSLAAAAS